jgi:hypothetical protein
MTTVVVGTDQDVTISAEPDDDVQVVADFEVELIQVPEQGPPGPMGNPGLDGADGNTIIYGTADPVPSQGKDGDSYINTVTHFIFGPKASGLWPTGVSLVGPTGAAIAFVNDNPPTGVPDGSLWWESDTGILYFRYNDGNSTQWVIACPQPDPNTFLLKSGDTMTGFLTLSATPTAPLHAANKGYVDGISGVRYDIAQSLSAAQQIQARQNIYAAPLDALSYDGMQINGGMAISQENGTTVLNFPSGTSGSNLLDGFLVFKSGTMAISAQQVTDAPPGYTNSLKLSVTTGLTSLGASDYVYPTTRLEGIKIAKMAWGNALAAAVTVVFWAKANRAGQYSVALSNGAGNRYYTIAYTILASNTWEFKVVTIPGDVAGAWANDNTLGLNIYWPLAAGSTITGVGGVWGATQFIAAAGQINGVAATTDTFQITGVGVYPGSDAPSAARAPYLTRSADIEQRLCQRYLSYTNGGFRFTAAGAGTTYENMIGWPVQMRGVPANTLGSPLLQANVGATYPQVQNPTVTAARFLIASAAAGDTYWLLGPVKADARL